MPNQTSRVPPPSGEAGRAAGSGPAYDLAALRKDEFPWCDSATYLDHASIGPVPERTRLAVEAMNRRRSRPLRRQ